VLTDGLLGLGMGVEAPEKDTMSRPPYSPKEGVFSRGAGLQVIWVGVLIGVLALGLGAWYYFTGREEWQTMVFTFLAFVQVFQAWASRSGKESAFSMPVMSNPLLFWMMLVVTALQLAVIYIPPAAEFFSIQPLRIVDLLIAIGAGFAVMIVMEVEKRFRK
jgi:P-type Ca2+ transporter type 2C